MKTTLASKKAKLIEYIDYLNDEQIDVLQFIVDMANKPIDKHSMVEFIRSVPIYIRN